MDAGADVNRRSEYGITPLQKAVANGQIDAVKLLLGRGADPALEDDLGITPLQYAEMEGEGEIAELLKSYFTSTQR